MKAYNPRRLARGRWQDTDNLLGAPKSQGERGPRAIITIPFTSVSIVVDEQAMDGKKERNIGVTSIAMGAN